MSFFKFLYQNTTRNEKTDTKCPTKEMVVVVKNISSEGCIEKFSMVCEIEPIKEIQSK